MLFENPSIELHNLPQVEALEFLPLEKAYLKVNYISTLIFFLVLLIGFIIALTTKAFEDVPMVLFGLLGLWVVMLLFSLWLNWKNFQIRGYALRHHDISYRTGVFFFSTTTIPFNRVQHCEVKQGPIERWFDLNTLQVFTAGGQSSDLVVPGLSPDRAKQLKSLIINKTGLVIDGIDEEE